MSADDKRIPEKPDDTRKSDSDEFEFSLKGGGRLFNFTIRARTKRIVNGLLALAAASILAYALYVAIQKVVEHVG